MADENELLAACENFFESWFGPAIGAPEAMEHIQERRKKTKQEFAELLFRFVQAWQPKREMRVVDPLQEGYATRSGNEENE